MKEIDKIKKELEETRRALLAANDKIACLNRDNEKLGLLYGDLMRANMRVSIRSGSSVSREVVLTVSDLYFNQDDERKAEMIRFTLVEGIERLLRYSSGIDTLKFLRNVGKL